MNTGWRWWWSWQIGPSIGAAALMVGLGGLLGAGAAQAAPAPTGPPTPASTPPPCVVSVKACVDLSAQLAWIGDGRGHVVRGPVPITSGTLQEPTPAGMFVVGRKDIDHVSGISGTPMPYSVFFDVVHGDAFHEGSLQRESDGCVHLLHDDAVAFYNFLRIGDRVQIVP